MQGRVDGGISESESITAAAAQSQQDPGHV
jgi:hypothetical protein